MCNPEFVIASYMCISIFMKKLLITSGCSFSECLTSAKTWPKYLAKVLPEYEHKSYAMGSQGNGLISRSIIYGVNEALKTHDPADILVGVMWSGSNRHDFRYTEPNLLHFVSENIHNGWIENPTGFVKDTTKNWVILNPNWNENNKEAEIYYKMFHDDIGSSIYSIEHILRTQWFLQSKNIKYFFTNHMDYNIVAPDYITHPEISYLYKEINTDYYLPVSSQYSWITQNSKHIESHPGKWESRTGPHHPCAEMHEEFVDECIVPWLREKKYI